MGNAVPLRAIIAVLVAIATIIGGFLIYERLGSDTVHPVVTVATGSESGVYHALGLSLKRVLERSDTFDSVQVRPTNGSAHNMQLIGQPVPEVDLAFVQGDAAPTTHARLVTALYDEVLHIMVSRAQAANIRDIFDLEGKRVDLGPEGSGTRELSKRVLLHFGVQPAEELRQDPEETAQALIDGTIDAAFMLTAIPSRLIAELARLDAIRFLSLGDTQAVGDEAHALELVFPGMKSNIIPRSTYIRLPQNAVHTVSVTGLLVAHKDLDDELVRSITASIFDNRSGSAGLEGTNLMVARKIREDYDPASVAMAYHPGAAAFYRREEPPFFVEYAEALSFGLTLLLAIYSISIAVREFLRRKMKNRVDAYLLEVDRLSLDIDKMNRDEILGQYRKLENLRRAAFADLVSENLLADEAFIILQNHFRDELTEIETRLQGLPDADNKR